MSEPAAILATFAGFSKPIIGRKVVPLIFEVPLERFPEAMRVLGVPDAADPVWCGIALTNLKGPAAVAHKAVAATAVRISWDALPASQRATQLCASPEFWVFLTKRLGLEVTAIDEAAEALMELLAIDAVAQLDAPGAGAEAFTELSKDWGRYLIAKSAQ